MLNVKVLFLELYIRNTLSGEKRLLSKLRKDLHDTVFAIVKLRIKRIH